MLGYCNNCREYSVKVKVYVRESDGKKCRVEYCMNANCGYRKALPFPEDSPAVCTNRRKLTDVCTERRI